MRNENQKIQEQIAGLLGSLKRVDPPGDFDFKVRARIAKGRPVTTTGSWLPASVRLAVPLGLMLAVGGYFGFNAISSRNAVDVPVVAEIPSTNPQPLPFAQVMDESVSPTSPTVARVTEVKPPVARETNKFGSSTIRKTSTRTRTTEPSGGSIDSALTPSKMITRAGIDPNANTPVTPEPVSALRITAKDALEKIGVRATFNGGGWKVDSVAADSAAGRSGVRAGDTIETFNGKKLAEKGTVDGSSAAKGVIVRRDGRIVIVGLRP